MTTPTPTTAPGQPEDDDATPNYLPGIIAWAAVGLVGYAVIGYMLYIPATAIWTGGALTAAMLSYTGYLIVRLFRRSTSEVAVITSSPAWGDERQYGLAMKAHAMAGFGPMAFTIVLWVALPVVLHRTGVQIVTSEQWWALGIAVMDGAALSWLVALKIAGRIYARNH